MALREVQDKLRVYSQFHTATEHSQFVRSLAKERALRLRIRELVKYRRNGLTRQEECTEHERARYFRERRKEARQERMRRKSVRPAPSLCLAPPPSSPVFSLLFRFRCSGAQSSSVFLSLVKDEP